MAEHSQEAARRLVEELWRLLPSALASDLFKADQLRYCTELALAYGRAQRREALEEAAKVALTHANHWANEPHRSDARMQACLGVASAIRSLLDSEPGAGR